jgi:hypothetical protein
MNRLNARLLALAIALVLAGSARADFTDWSFSWSLNPAGPTFTNGNSNVAFAIAPGGAGAATIPIGNITASSSSLATDSFNTPFSLVLHLKDNPSSASGNLTWNGLIAGAVGPTSSTLVNNFSGAASQSITLGSHTYQVTIEPFTNAVINAPGGASTLLDAQVVVSNATTGGGGNNGGGNNGGGNNKGGGTQGGQVQNVPEPSTLVLAGCAVSLAGLGRCRRRARRGAVA